MHVSPILWKDRQEIEISKAREQDRSRFIVSSPPLVNTVRPSTENVIDPVSVPFAWASATVMLGLTKFELACHTWMAPSRHAALAYQWWSRRESHSHVPPPIRFPSVEYAQAVTLVLAPRSLDLMTMTVFCFRLFSTSQILDVRSQCQME